MLCVHVLHDVCIVLVSSLIFLAFCYMMMGRKNISFLFYHNTPLQTCSTPRISRSCTCLRGDKGLVRISAMFSCVET